MALGYSPKTHVWQVGCRVFCLSCTPSFTLCTWSPFGQFKSNIWVHSQLLSGLLCNSVQRGRCVPYKRGIKCWYPWITDLHCVYSATSTRYLRSPCTFLRKSALFSWFHRYIYRYIVVLQNDMPHVLSNDGTQHFQAPVKCFSVSYSA